MSAVAPEDGAPAVVLPEAQRKRAFAFILCNLMLDAMGIGLIIPVMPDLLEEISGAGLGQAALWGGLLATSFAAMQFLFSPLLGSLSDAYGRKPVLLVSLGIMAVDYVVMALAGALWLLLIARIMAGIMAATQATATAYIADISRPEDKGKNFGLVGAAFGLGFVLGPVLGGILGEYGTRAPFWAAAALGVANLIFGLLFLPETVDRRRARRLDLRSTNPFTALRAIGRLEGVAPLLVVFFVYQFAFTVYPAVWPFYGKAAFGWSPGTIGASLALFGISMAVVQGGLIGPGTRLMGERRLILFGIAFNGAIFVYLGFATSGAWTLALLPASALGAIVVPVLQGRMSRAVPDDRQGLLQGCIASVQSVSMIFGPLAMTQVFAATTDAQGGGLPGAPFLLSAALMIPSTILFVRAARVGARDTPETRAEDP
ncbi:MAG: TCR/Tet family MFS transporter [Paracoccaceae bacterium]